MFLVPILAYCSKKWTLANSADTDEILQNAASDQSLHFLYNTRNFFFNPIALRTAKTEWSFGSSQCNRVKTE